MAVVKILHVKEEKKVRCISALCSAAGLNFLQPKNTVEAVIVGDAQEVVVETSENVARLVEFLRKDVASVA